MAEALYKTKDYECVEFNEHVILEKDTDNTIYVHCNFPNKSNTFWRMINSQATRLFDFAREEPPRNIGSSTTKMIYTSTLGPDYELWLFYDLVSSDLSIVMCLPCTLRVLQNVYDRCENVTEASAIQFYADLVRELKAEQDVAQIYRSGTLLGNYSH